MPKNRIDRQDTQRIIQSAMADLLREEAYHKITIKGIVDHAMVSRNTFYTHFIDKEDLLKALFLGCLYDIRQALGDLTDSGFPLMEVFEEIVDIMLQSFARNQSVYESAYDYLDRQLIRDRTHALILEALWLIHEKSEGRRSEASSIRIEFMAAGFTHVIDMWIQNHSLPRADISKAVAPFMTVL